MCKASLPVAAIADDEIVLGQFFGFQIRRRFLVFVFRTFDCLSKAFGPPAITAWTHSGGALKVGGISAASVMAIRPLVPAPT